MSKEKYPFDESEGFELPHEPSAEELVHALQSGDYESHEETLIYGLSNLSKETLGTIAPIWRALDVQYRQLLMQTLIDEAEDDYTLNYESLAQITLGEDDTQLKLLALEMLEPSEDTAIMEQVLRIAHDDSNLAVKAEAMRLLATYAYRGAVNEIPARIYRAVYQYLLDAYHSHKDSLIRGRALEGLAYTDHPDLAAWINAAYHTDDETLRLSAIVAMGRTADADAWGDTVLSMLETAQDEFLVEAVRACGELRISEAVRELSQYVYHKTDIELQEVSVWALGEIGSKEAVRILQSVVEHAEETENDALLEIAEDALATAGFIGGKFLGIG